MASAAGTSLATLNGARDGEKVDSMKKGFYTIMAAQFFSSLADNALLIAAIALLTELHSPQWMTPLLKLFFVLSYVILAAFVGAFADSMPKGRVMLITNAIKVVGCAIMMFGLHPLLAYGVVGFGARAGTACARWASWISSGATWPRARWSTGKWRPSST